MYQYVCACVCVLKHNNIYFVLRILYLCVVLMHICAWIQYIWHGKSFLQKRTKSCSERIVGERLEWKWNSLCLSYYSGCSWWSSPSFHLFCFLFCLSQPFLPDLWGRPIVTDGTPLLSVQPLHPGAPLRCWFSYLPATPLQSFLQAALNRQSLRTPGNLYTPVSGHWRCISNCQCALPDAVLSFDPIHSGGCVPVAVIYTYSDFTDV